MKPSEVAGYVGSDRALQDHGIPSGEPCILDRADCGTGRPHLGVIAYDAPHLKTEQLLLRWADRYQITVYGLPFIPRPARKVRFSHRPDQSIAVHPRDICQWYGFRYLPVQSDLEIGNECDFYHVTVGKLLSAECLEGKRVLNGHPGVIPAARGLDAFKWSIYHLLPLGITLHYIDKAVDAGEVLSVVPTPVFPSDSLETLARRHYENEIAALGDFERHIAERQNLFADIPLRESTRRMNAALEVELPNRFKVYKQKFCGDGVSFSEEQIPPSGGTVEG